MRTSKQSKPIETKHYVLLKRACNSQKLKNAMALLFYCGFRVNEVKQFLKTDIEQSIKGNELIADIIKQGIIRDVNLSDKAKAELSTLLLETKGDYFVRYRGDSLRVCLNRFIKKVLGEGFTSHGFRRNAITTIINSHNPRLAQDWIGHKDLKTTLGYYHSSSENLKKASNSIG